MIVLKFGDLSESCFKPLMEACEQCRDILEQSNETTLEGQVPTDPKLSRGGIEAFTSTFTKPLQNESYESSIKFPFVKHWRYQERIMYECFQEIAFEAEVNTREDPELCELAYELCHEDINTRDAAVEELRDMIYERGECQPLRTDDEFLRRFLRATKYTVPKAHRLLVRYCTFREQYPYLYKDVDLWGLMKVKDAYEGTLNDRPDIGRISVFRFGMWDPSEFPVEELVRAGMLITEIGIRQPKLQVIGGTVIVDLEGLTLRHVATLTPTVAHQIVSLMGLTVPCRMKSCHIINYSWILNTFIYLFKRFIPRQTWDKIFFHGYNLKSLQEHIDLECLPPRYGGTCRNFAGFATWLGKVKKYRDKEFDSDMKQLGYLVKE